LGVRNFQLGQRRELIGAGLYAEDGIIKQIASNDELPGTVSSQ
jgi:hypothetical protein